MRNFGDAVSALDKDERATMSFSELEGWFPLEYLHIGMSRYISSGKWAEIISIDNQAQTAVIAARRAF